MNTPPPTVIHLPETGQINAWGRIALAVVVLEVAFLAAVVLLTLLGVFITQSSDSPEAVVAGIAIPIALAIALGTATVLFFRRRTRRQFESARSLPPEEQFRRLRPMIRSLYGRQRLARLLKQLAADGHRNLLVRLTPLSELRPIDVPFEPISWEMCGTRLAGDNPGQALPDEAAAQDTAYQVNRRLRLKGGRWLIPVFGLLLAFYAYQAWQRRTLLYPPFLAWCLLFVSLFFAPVRGSLRQARTWLVPGALLTRAPVIPLKAVLRLFRRADCAAAAYRLNRAQWGLMISDGDQVAQTIGTKDEVDFALSALASPVPPPSLEMLENLA